MTKKVKSSNPSTIPEGISKPSHLWETIGNDALRFFPEKDAWRKRLILSLLTFFKNPEVLVWEEFCQEFDIPRRTLDGWCSRYEDLAETKRHVMIMIAARRRKGVMNFNLQQYASFRDMHVYDPEWKDVEKFHADLKNSEESGKSGIVYVHAHQLPEKKEE